jgi:YD repeat-containing protein
VENNGGVATSYSYNAKNQLASTTNAQGVTQYAYNIDGIRISQTLGATNTVYVVDSNRDYAQVLNKIRATPASPTPTVMTSSAKTKQAKRPTSTAMVWAAHDS